eukprot:6027368-Ditylum_brightwellii.AAC.1
MEHLLSSSFPEKRKPGSDTTLYLCPECIHNVADEVALLSSMLQLIQKTNVITKEQISTQEVVKIIAEIMDVMAHKLALSGNYAAGVKAARDTWNMHHSVHNL